MNNEDRVTRLVMAEGHTHVVRAAVRWAVWRLGQCDADELNPEEQALIDRIEEIVPDAFR